MLLVAVRAGVQLASVTKPTIVGSNDHGKQERNHRAGCSRPIVNRLEPVLLRAETSLQERFGEERGSREWDGPSLVEHSWRQQLHVRDREIPCEGCKLPYKTMILAFVSTHKDRAMDAALWVPPEDAERLCSSNEDARHGNGEGVAVGVVP